MIDAVSSSTTLFRQTPRRSAGGADSREQTAATETQSAEVQQQVQKLRTVDQQVRAHEQAHVAAGGPYAGSPSYQFVRGPDNRNYAVAGDVPIDLSAERDPEATIRKMETIKRAALAPGDPSAQDLRVAAQADAIAAQAQAELRAERAKEAEGKGSDGAGAPNVALAARGAVAYGSASRIGASSAPALSVTA